MNHPRGKAWIWTARLAAALLLGSPNRAGTSPLTAPNPPTEPKIKPARLIVRGHGFLGNLRLKQQLRVLQPDSGPPEFLDSRILEDAALLLLSALQREGYLEPAIELQVLCDDGTESVLSARPEAPLEAPAHWRARRAVFLLDRGAFHYYARLDFTGLTALSKAKAAGYFLVPDMVVPQKKPKVYTPARLDRGLASLREELRRLGYRDAVVERESAEADPLTGKVSVAVRVEENRRWWVTKLETRCQDRPQGPDGPVQTILLREPFSPAWEQECIRSLRNAEYAKGLPDARVTIETETLRETENEVEVRVLARVERGAPFRVGEVTFDGLNRTRESLVRKRVPLVRGEPLDRLAIDEARLQLLRLGVFDRAEAEIAPATAEDARDVRFQLREAKPIEASLLAGWGSYDLLWGGFELEQINLFGLAHRQRLVAAQSLKSTKLEYAYTIPQVFSPLGEVTGLGFYRRREETTFTRRDSGASLGYQRLVPSLHSSIGLRFTFEELSADDSHFDPDYGRKRASASSVGLTLDHNRTDNALYPARGYRLFVTTELATDTFGGTANYTRFELGGSWHRPLSRTLIAHLGASHAWVTTPGLVGDDLPFNKRFFLGGASSVRGYVQGEAASYDPAGRLVGDESYLLGQAEIEQRLTPRWSLVGFLDVAGLARDIAEYPASEVVASVGAGIRWRTPIGPVRLEYGHNLNRRHGDPAGSLHFSVGFPF